MNGIIGSLDVNDSSIVDRTHPPVTLSLEAAGDQGTLAAGLIVAYDDAGKIVPYDPEAEAESPELTPVGVLVHAMDTSSDEVAVVLVHGTVVKGALLVGDAAPDSTDLGALRAIGIWAV